jgi:hypothetical protein
VPLTPARTAADLRRRFDGLASRAMTAVGDWISPDPRPGPSEPRISAIVALVALIGGVLPILVMVVTWAAKPGPVRRDCPAAGSGRSGNVLADRPAEGHYKPSEQCNSAQGENRVERTATGRYVVTFGGLGTDGGVAEVTPVTTEDRICTLPDWRPDGADEQVEVACFDRAGAPADSGFSARYRYLRNSAGAAAYLRLGDPGGAGQTIEDAYSFHSQPGGINSADREHVGSYVIYLGRLDGATGGTVQVTAIGEAATVCGVERWFGYPEGGYLAVRVICRDAAGQAVDSRFGVSFTVGADGAYLRADRPSEARYTATGDFQFNSTGQSNTVTRAGAGDYHVSMPGVTGSVQVTAYDSDATCVAAPGDVRVICRAPTGVPADASFLLAVRP